MSYKMYCDGCYLKEFGISGVGGYLLKGEETIFEFSEEITNNLYFKLHERFP